jgi:phosphate transport system substrate-binding protein
LRRVAAHTAATAALAGFAALAGSATAEGATRTITMNGAPITRALVADLAYFYRRQRPRAPRFALAAGGTSTGIADTARRVTDAGLVARRLAADDPPGLRLTPLAYSGVCLTTNKANPVPEITRAQLQGIVAGHITLWSQIPGSPRSDPIVPVDQGPTSGSTRVFQDTFVDDATPLGWRPVTLATSQQARDFTERNPAALAYVDLAFTQTLNVLAFDGVPCTRATVADGRYAARRPLGVVTRGRPRGALRRFLRWARTSRTARRVIATRYLPA